jgi:hypothetical protein
MVKHIVLFKLKDFDYEWEKRAKMEEIRRAFKALPAEIAAIRSIRVDFNINPLEIWDIILTAEFDNLRDVSVYSSHPAHKAVADKLIAPVKIDRACIDYQM